MNRRIGFSVGMIMLIAFSAVVLATDAEMYFSSDKNGQNRVTNVQEGDSVWIVIIDNDENIDCDVRDKIWTDVKLIDPKTGASLVWISYMDASGDASGNKYADVVFGEWKRLYTPYKGHWPGPTAGWLGGDYLEETGADTGVFVSKRSFQVGAREDYDTARKNTHVVADGLYGGETWPDDFQWGHYLYVSDDDGTDPEQGYFDGTLTHRPGGMLWLYVNMPVWPDAAAAVMGDAYLVGRFENMDTLVGMYQDPNDGTDVAIGLMKIIDTEAAISWSQEIYKDANSAATITIVDPDENLNCSQVEYVPVFILVNPGSWNPVDGSGNDGGRSPTNFCMLKRTGGVYGGNANGAVPGALPSPLRPIRWYNIYHSTANTPRIPRGAGDGLYYIEYPVEGDSNVTFFNTVNADGITPVSFYAQETGVNTGVFQLNLNDILTDLQFKALNIRDVLVAYYLDPNDFDDFKLATAYIEERQHSITSFTDENRADKDLFWIGRDPVYVQVIDANANVDPCCPEQVVVHVCDPHGEDDSEWLILDETSSNSPVFFTFAGTQLWPVWDALGVGLSDAVGGFQLQLDNWKIEAFNEDDIYVRYNDVYYGAPELTVSNDINHGTPKFVPAALPLNDVSSGLAGLGDSDIHTSFPPFITRGSSNTVTSIGPTAIYPGVRVANDVSFALMSIADTQVYDGLTVNMWFLDRQGNRVSGYVNSDCVFVEVIDPDQNEDQYRRERIDGYWDGGQSVPFGPVSNYTWLCGPKAGDAKHPINDLLGYTTIFNESTTPKVYLLNPRSGYWASVDLLETGPATGDFVSVICIDLTNVYECAPSLGVLPGDTIIAVYQDPSNHSDSAWISIKVGIGGGGTPPSQQSTTMFVDADGDEVAAYSDADDVFVEVTDPSHAGATLLASAVELDGIEYDLLPLGTGGEFMTEAIELNLIAGQTITATYTDPTDQTDVSSDTVSIVSSGLVIESFVVAPNPFEASMTFSYVGTGIASVMTVAIYDLSGQLLWEIEGRDVSELTWDGTAGARCLAVANGCYIYVISATDGTNAFSHTGKLFVSR